MTCPRRDYCAYHQIFIIAKWAENTDYDCVTEDSYCEFMSENKFEPSSLSPFPAEKSVQTRKYGNAEGETCHRDGCFGTITERSALMGRRYIPILFVCPVCGWNSCLDASVHNSQETD